MVFWKSLVSFNFYCTNYHSEREKSTQRFTKREPELLCGPERVLSDFHDVFVSLCARWSTTPCGSISQTRSRTRFFIYDISYFELAAIVICFHFKVLVFCVVIFSLFFKHAHLVYTFLFQSYFTASSQTKWKWEMLLLQLADISQILIRYILFQITCFSLNNIFGHNTCH